MPKSTIRIDVTLDEQKMPEKISWNATDTLTEEDRSAKACLLSFWDGQDRTALRIDLWTKDMMVDEMADFFFQTMMSMADTYHRATRHHEASNEMKTFAKDFYKKFQDQHLKEQGK